MQISAVSRRHDAVRLKVRENGEMSKLAVSIRKEYQQRLIENRRIAGLTPVIPTSVSLPQCSQQLNYNFDSIGRLSSVSATGYSTGYVQGNWPNWSWYNQNVTSFVSGISYRAWGAVKQMTYGNGVQLAMSYNTREQATRYELSNFYNQPNAGATYDYYADGKIHDTSKLENHVFDRAYTYDQAGRIQDALTGSEARGGSTPDGPYRENFAYDSFGNTVSQTKRLWSGSATTNTATVVNNRRNDFSYDANGFATTHYDDSLSYIHQYDAEGKRSKLIPAIAWFNGQPAVEFNDSFDGDGLPDKRVDIRRDQDPETGFVYTASNTTTYYLHSTMLGNQVVVELDSQGNKRAGHVYVNGMQFANESLTQFYGTHTLISWQLVDPITGARAETEIHRYYTLAQELDPVGSDVTSPPPDPDPLTYQPPVYSVPESPVSKLLDFNSNDDLDPWYLNMVNKDQDARMAELLYKHGFIDKAQEILARNPNVGIIVSGKAAGFFAELPGHQVDSDGSVTFWGEQAANALGLVDHVNELLAKNHPQNSGPERAAFSMERFKGCVASLWKFTRATLDSASFNRQSGGSARISFESPINIEPFPIMTHASITTNVTKYNISTLPSSQPGYETAGYTNLVFPGTNYIASDFASSKLTDDVGLLAVWVHETGNSISGFTGQFPHPKDSAIFGDDTDSGAALEECTFGGAVTTGGFLNRSKR